MKFLIFLLALNMFLAACSSGDNSSDEAQIEIGDAQTIGEEEDFFEEDEEVEIAEANDDLEMDVEAEGETLLDTASTEMNDRDVADVEMPVNPIQPNLNGEYYQVQGGDTLMLVSFKIYGDYRKWRTLYKKNRDVLGGSTQLKPGMRIRFDAPHTSFVWNPEGNPYLIKNGDNLGKISSKVYGQRKLWRSIWDNNKPLIRDPNLIFAGFTVYYLDKETAVSRMMASH